MANRLCVCAEGSRLSAPVKTEDQEDLCQEEGKMPGCGGGMMAMLSQAYKRRKVRKTSEGCINTEIIPDELFDDL